MDQPLSPGEWGKLAGGQQKHARSKPHDLILDITFGCTGALLILYGLGCGISASVDYFMRPVCENDPDSLWPWLLISGICSILRPAWSQISPYCPRGTIYQACKTQWAKSCCCGCSWAFPWLCCVAFGMITAGHILVGATVYGVTDGVRAEDGAIEVTFWSQIEANWKNNQWLIMFLSLFFNVFVLYVCLPLMVVCWFNPRKRGLIVTFVCLSTKWVTFHSYSQIINALSLAFEFFYPIGAEFGLYLETVVEAGALYGVVGNFVALGLVQTLLYAYAHSRRDPEDAGDQAEDDSPFGNSDAGVFQNHSEGDGDKRRSSGGRGRRGSATQVGYYSQTETGEVSQALFMRIQRRAAKERVTSSWAAITDADAGPCERLARSARASMGCVRVAQVLLPLLMLLFFVSLYIGTFANGTLTINYVTGISCLIPGDPGLVCPNIEPVGELDQDGVQACRAVVDEDRFPFCGQYTASMAQLIEEVWTGKVGFQHALEVCEVDDDCDERIGLPCNDGFCQPGPIINYFNRILALLLTIGPIGLIPQLQVVLLAVLWLLPMRVRTMSHVLLASQMAMAWSTLDVWTVMLAVRVPDLERYSIDAQLETCGPLGGALIPPVSICYAALGSLGWGFGFLCVACVLQWVLTLVVGFNAGSVILTWVDDMETQSDLGADGRVRRTSSAPIPANIPRN